MLRPPPLGHVLYYPVTAHVAAAAISLSCARWASVDLHVLTTDYHTWPWQPWRLLTSALLHGDPIHLIFNLYWLWAFGTIVENRLRSLRTIALYIMLAAGSSMGEFALFEGGIGLSGVVYGLFGMLWVLSRRDPQFYRCIDYHTSAMLVFWFFFCILLTIAKVWLIANVAHGAGALLGFLLGWAMAARTRWQRRLYWVGLIATLVLLVAASWWGRPYINLSPHRGHDLAAAGVRALQQKRPEEAVRLMRAAIRMNPRQPDWWHNLGVAYFQLGQMSEARDALAHERKLRPEPEVEPEAEK